MRTMDITYTGKELTMSGVGGEFSDLETTNPGEKLVKAAFKAGVKKDQLQNFLERAYVPTEKQLEFHSACRLADADDGPTKIGFGGRRGPGKSHAAFAQAVLDDCVRFAGLKVLYLRKVG